MTVSSILVARSGVIWRLMSVRRGWAIVAFIVSPQISLRLAGSSVNRKRERMESIKHHRLKFVRQP